MSKSVQFLLWKLEDTRVDLWNPSKIQGLAMCFCKPSAGQVEVGEA